MKRIILATAVAAAVNAAPVLAEYDLEKEQDKLSYSLGMMLGANITQRFGDLNFDALIEGLSKQHQGLDTDVSIQDAQTILGDYEKKAAEEAQAKAAERAKVAASAGAEYLAENKTREGVMVTESGLQYEVLQEADGPKPEVTDTVSVHYVGTLLDGTEFDSSVARGQPAEFGLQGVIPGWTEGLQLMNTGSKFRFVIPSNLAYGSRGTGGQIGPDETLIFEVELLEIK